MDKIRLTIYTPEGTICDKMVSAVTLPGSHGRFTILKNHSPIISSLEKGIIRYTSEGTETELQVSEGFVEGKENSVAVSVESYVK